MAVTGWHHNAIHNNHLKRNVGVVLTVLAALALAFWTRAAAAEEPAAVLAVVSGSVHIQRGDAAIAGTFGATLQAGDVVETGKDGEAAILFESGQIIELSSGSRMSIGSLPEKNEPVMAQVPDAFQGSLTRFAQKPSDQGLTSLPDLRSGGAGDTPVPVAPRHSLVTPGNVRFQWSPVEDAMEYRVILTGPDGATLQESAAGTEWTGGEGTFAAGQKWTWKVEAVTMDGDISSETVTFEVATPEQVAELSGLREKLAPLLDSEDVVREDAAAYLLGSYCRSTGFLDEAIVQLETVARRNPERKEIHRELGYLYQAVGRNDKAAEAYRLALKE